MPEVFETKTFSLEDAVLRPFKDLDCNWLILKPIKICSTTLDAPELITRKTIELSDVLQLFIQHFPSQSRTLV